MEFQKEQFLSDVAEQLRVWEVPSASVCVVRGDEVLLADGVGLRDGKSQLADGETLYQIASCSKAFTATAAAILATEGRLDLDAPVAEYLPAFRMQDPYASSHLTARDFLSHRSGLPRHEYAWYGTGFTRQELMENLRYLPLSAPIRYTFQYSNFNYLIAGCLIEAVSGLPFEEFLRQRIFLPLGMEHTVAFSEDMLRSSNYALPFDREEPYAAHGIREIPFDRSPAERPGVGDPTAAAGCVISCAGDMAKWLRFQLDRGRVNGQSLVREDLMDLLYTPHIHMGDDPAHAPERTMMSYGLGWMACSYRGRRMVEHGGNINGFSTYAAVLPEEQLGIFASANMNVTLLAEAIVRDAADRLLGHADGNWYERLRRRNAQQFQELKSFYASFGGETVPGTTPSHPLADYAGDYAAPGYRRFRITCENGALKADFNTFVVGLRHLHYDSFATRGVIGELPAGLVLTFGTDAKGRVRTLSAVLGNEAGLAPIVFTK